MSASKLARRYAQALAELAAERGILEAVEAGAELVGGLLQQEPALVLALDDDRVPLEERLARLQELFGDRLPPLFYHFFRLVLTKGGPASCPRSVPRCPMRPIVSEAWWRRT